MYLENGADGGFGGDEHGIWFKYHGTARYQGDHAHPAKMSGNEHEHRDIDIAALRKCFIGLIIS